MCFLTRADWPEASITALFFPLDFLCTVVLRFGRGKPFSAISQGVWALALVWAAALPLRPARAWHTVYVTPQLSPEQLPPSRV